MNWVTLGFIGVLLLSAACGAWRGLAEETGHVVARLVGLGAMLLALCAAWITSNYVSSALPKVDKSRLPSWLEQVAVAWQQSPRTAHLIAFIVCYLLFSAILRAILRPWPSAVVRMIPRRMGENRVLGTALGGGLGAAQAVVLGGALFTVLQYLSLPAVASEASHSSPYRWLSARVYTPWLKPLAEKTLPVLESGALQPLSQNINLFVVPASSSGQQVGMVVVPRQVAALAHSVTAGSHTDRDRAHALYEWEIHHIHYDWTKYNDYVYHHKWDGQSPLQTLQTGKGVCADYALLYADMAHSVGLTVEIDEGVGGTANDNGPHAWNRVWDGSKKTWFPVDTTWGSEQDAWFDPARFSDTHATQTTIKINGDGH